MLVVDFPLIWIFLRLSVPELCPLSPSPVVHFEHFFHTPELLDGDQLSPVKCRVFLQTKLLPDKHVIKSFLTALASTTRSNMSKNAVTPPQLFIVTLGNMQIRSATVRPCIFLMSGGESRERWVDELTREAVKQTSLRACS